MNAGRLGGDGGEDDLRCRHREVGPVMFAHAYEGQANLIGQLPLKDEVANGLRLRQLLAVGANRRVAKGIEPQFNR
jgi:hypothetical protein